MIRYKLGCVYRITHKPTGYYYIGLTVDFAQRISQHLTQLKIRKHSSKKLQSLWDITSPEQWIFEILEYISKTDFKAICGLKGKSLDTSYRKHLLMREKAHMKVHSINYALNADNKNFS